MIDDHSLMKSKLILLAVFTLLAAVLPAAAQLRGTLLKANGKPLPYTEIELVPVDSAKIVNDYRLLATSNAAGRFSFAGVPPGRYTLSINFDDKPTDLSPYDTFFYPAAAARADAQIFEIDAATRPQTISFKLPPALRRGRIAGRIVDQKGAPVAGAWLALRDVAFDGKLIAFGAIKSDAQGNFTMQAFTARRYQVAAVLLLNPNLTIFDEPEIVGAAESDIFTLADERPFDLRLVLRERRDYDRLRDKYVGQTPAFMTHSFPAIFARGS